MIRNFFLVLLICFLLSCANNDIPAPACENVDVSYVNDIQPIIEMSCLINNSDCHGMNPSIPDWSAFSEVQSHAQAIKTRTRDRSMPKIGTLTQAQIDLITCWVDNGALDN